MVHGNADIMHAITCALFLWMHLLTFVHSQDCALEQFVNGPKYDSNFDITGLDAHYPGGKQVRVGCNVGYTGFFKLICVEGKWQTRGSKCQLKSCGHPGDAQFADIYLEEGDDFVFGSKVVYTCHRGYQMVSRTNFRHCMAEGWDGVVPVCEVIPCKVGIMHPGLTATGLPPASKTVQVGQKLQFDCSSDFQLDGSKEIECLETGQWSAPFPTCSEKCKVPRLSDDIQVTQGSSGRYLTEGQTLTFGCQRHEHVIQGNATVECLASGEWSSPFPTCGAPIGCGKPPPLEDGDTKETIKYQHRHNDKVEYICQNYYLMEGAPYMTCNNGEWTGRMRCLKPCTVDKDAMTRHNIRFRHRSDDKLYSTHNDSITFSCTYGTSPVGTVEMRQKCINGVIDLPTCQ